MELVLLEESDLGGEVDLDFSFESGLESESESEVELESAPEAELASASDSDDVELEVERGLLSDLLGTFLPMPESESTSVLSNGLPLAFDFLPNKPDFDLRLEDASALASDAALESLAEVESSSELNGDEG